MSLELVLATAAISMALVFYTVGVFSERRAGSLSLRLTSNSMSVPAPPVWGTALQTVRKMLLK